MRYRSVTGVLLALTFATAACGGDESSAPASDLADVASPAGEPTSSLSSGAKVACAAVFDRAAASALAGHKVGAPVGGELQGLPTCEWSAADGAFIQVLSVPAKLWAQILPSAIDTVLANQGLEFPGRDDLQAARDRISEGETLDDTAACGVFSTLAVALSDQPAGTVRFVSYQPTEDAPESVNGQACIEGRYYSVLYAAPGFSKGPAIQRRIDRALDRAIAKSP